MISGTEEQKHIPQKILAEFSVANKVNWLSIVFDYDTLNA